MDYILELNDNEIETLINMSNILIASPSEDTEYFCSCSKNLSRCLPNWIISKLKHFAKHGSETGFLLIKTLPVNDVPETPTGNNYKVGEKTILARIQSILLHIITTTWVYMW